MCGPFAWPVHSQLAQHQSCCIFNIAHTYLCDNSCSGKVANAIELSFSDVTYVVIKRIHSLFLTHFVGFFSSIHLYKCKYTLSAFWMLHLHRLISVLSSLNESFGTFETFPSLNCFNQFYFKSLQEETLFLHFFMSRILFRNISTLIELLKYSNY